MKMHNSLPYTGRCSVASFPGAWKTQRGAPGIPCSM